MKDIEERHLEDFLPAGFDPHQAMRVLADYLRNIETTFDEVKKTSHLDRRQLESDLRTLTKVKDDQRQEIERLTSDLIELTNTLEEQESLLSTANQKVANYETQFKKLHRENSDLRSKLTQKENDADFFRQEMERSVQEAESSAAAVILGNNRLDELERKLAVEREAAATYEKEVRRLTLALSESQGKITLTEHKMEELVVKYNDEIKRLTERSNADAQHEANLLKKRVKSSVAPEMRDLEKLMVDKLSIETASNFKALLSRFVSKLEQAGLDLK
jgi:chromosome segregation ATPase